MDTPPDGPVAIAAKLMGQHLGLLLQFKTWPPSTVQRNMPAPNPVLFGDLFDHELIERDSDGKIALTPKGHHAVEASVHALQQAAERPLNGYVIRYDSDGAYNYGEEGTLVNGHPALLSDASCYSSAEVAEQKAKDLRYPNGTGVTVMTMAEALALEFRQARSVKLQAHNLRGTHV